MIPRPLLPLFALVCLLPACNLSPIPNERNIDVNGSYTGRIVGPDNTSALLDVTIQEKNLQVTSTVHSRTTGESFTLSGTRSVYNASPVTVNVTSNLGSGSACSGGFTEQYSVNVTFYASKQDSASGYVTHNVCNATSKQFERSNVNSGGLELVRN